MAVSIYFSSWLPAQFNTAGDMICTTALSANTCNFLNARIKYNFLRDSGKVTGVPVYILFSRDLSCLSAVTLLKLRVSS